MRKKSDGALAAILYSPRYSLLLRHKAAFLLTEDMIILLRGEGCDLRELCGLKWLNLIVYRRSFPRWRGRDAAPTGRRPGTHPASLGAGTTAALAAWQRLPASSEDGGADLSVDFSRNLAARLRVRPPRRRSHPGERLTPRVALSLSNPTPRPCWQSILR